MKLAFKIAQTKHPISQKAIGYRMILAHINRAKYNQDTDEMEQSFRACYRVDESGDYTEFPDVTLIEKFIGNAQKWHKFQGIVV